MIFPQPLQQATLIKRYKRFLTDVELPNGEIITIHCPNTGSMRGCQDPGCKVWISDSGNPKRKYQFTWEIIEAPNGDKIGINTSRANHLVKEAISNGTVKELQAYPIIKPEVRLEHGKSRIDLLLEKNDHLCYVEVKNVTLSEGNQGYFPDAVTERGQKHLRELMDLKQAGHRAVLFFCVQHSGIETVCPADDIDPVYGELIRQAQDKGVEIIAYQASLSAKEIKLVKEIPYVN